MKGGILRLEPLMVLAFKVYRSIFFPYILCLPFRAVVGPYTVQARSKTQMVAAAYACAAALVP
jgi:hypothetical protein